MEWKVFLNNHIKSFVVNNENFVFLNLKSQASRKHLVSFLAILQFIYALAVVAMRKISMWYSSFVTAIFYENVWFTFSKYHSLTWMSTKYLVLLWNKFFLHVQRKYKCSSLSITKELVRFGRGPRIVGESANSFSKLSSDQS